MHQNLSNKHTSSHENEDPTDKRTLRNIEKIVLAKEYLKSLSLALHERVVEIGETRKPYTSEFNGNHEFGLTRQERRELSAELYDKNLTNAEEAGITPEQHHYWCEQAVDFAFDYVKLTLITSLATGDKTLDEVFKEQVQMRDSEEERLLVNLVRTDPIVAYNVLHTAYNITDPESELVTGHREQGVNLQGLYASFRLHAGQAFDAITEFKTALNAHFKKRRVPARTLLMSFVDESDRLVTEASAYMSALVGCYSRYPNTIPGLYYWPEYPNRRVSRERIVSVIEKNTFPIMDEFLPELKGENLKASSLMVPTYLHAIEIFTFLSTMTDIHKEMAKAICEGSAPENWDGERRKLTPRVSVFARDTGGTNKQARISFIVSPYDNQQETFTLRYDLEADGSLVLDLGQCDLESGLLYADLACPSPEKHKYTLKNALDDNGDIIHVDNKALLYKNLEEIDKRISPNERFSIIGACLSNLGMIHSLRKESVVSHHRREQKKRNYTDKEFSKAVTSFIQEFSSRDSK